LICILSLSLSANPTKWSGEWKENYMIIWGSSIFKITIQTKQWQIGTCPTSGTYPTNLGHISQLKLNRHSDERLVKYSDQNTQGVSRSKSQTESEQNWFSKNKTSWLFFPISSFCDSFMDLPPYLGANNIWKYLCEFFQRNTDAEWKLQKVGRNFTSFGKW